MKNQLIKKKSIITFIILLILIPAVVIAGGMIFKEKYYAWVSLCVAIFSSVPLFYCFERKKNTSAELVVLTVLVALSVTGRFIFSWIPGFKPVTAITIITAIWLGKESGFAVGAFTALISNFYFGQGSWTPFQMFAWGIIGFSTGLLSKLLKKSKIFLCIYGALMGVMFSMIMDIWTTIWADGSFNIMRYLASVISAIPLTIEYAISNIIFLIFLTKPIGEKLERLKKKYGLFMDRL